MTNDRAASISGIIEFPDGQRVEFSIDYDNTRRWGNTVENLGRAVDITDSMYDALVNDELLDRDDDEENDQ